MSVQDTVKKIDKFPVLITWNQKTSEFLAMLAATPYCLPESLYNYSQKMNLKDFADLLTCPLLLSVNCKHFDDHLTSPLVPSLGQNFNIGLKFQF